MGDRRFVQLTNPVAIHQRGRIRVEVEPAQRHERRNRRVDDQIGGPVEREIEIFFVLVDLSEEPAPSAATRRGDAREEQRRLKRPRPYRLENEVHSPQ